MRSIFVLILAIAGYAVLMLVLLAVPAALTDLAVQAALFGHIDGDGAIRLTSAGKFGLLPSIAILAYVLSITASAFAEVAFDKRYVSNESLFWTGVLLPFPVLITLRSISNVAGAIGDIETGDNAWVAGIVLFWLWTVANATKPVWDESRKRLVAYLKPQFSAFMEREKP